MKDDTTLLVITKNNQKTIKKTIIDLNKYQKKNRNIKNIIIADKKSTDKTIPIIIQTISELHNPTMTLTTNNKKEHTILKTINKHTKDNNIITLPPFKETNYNQIKKQIKLLRKTIHIIPNRYHPQTKNYMQPTNNKKTDYKNPNQAYKNKHINKILKKNNYRKLKTTTHLITRN